MQYTNYNDNAVSPVIGIILLVAITVILSVIIASLVFGLAGNNYKTKNLGLTAEKIDNNMIIVTNHGGKDLQNLVSLYCNGTYSNGSEMEGNPYILHPSIGSTITLPASSGRDHILIIGSWEDGAIQVMLDTYV